jgi:allene oxide cyclase
MSRATRTRLGIATAALIAATGVATAAQATSAQDRGGHVIHIHTKQVHQSVIDNGAEGFVDDVVIFSNDLYDQQGTKIGEDGGTCTVVRVTEAGAATIQCTGTNSLPGGQIAVQGLAAPGEPFEFAITGGTGRYSTARGQVVGHNTSSTEMDIDLILR